MIDPSPEHIAAVLHSRFGFAQFRAHQEEVCQASVQGRDVLLVMPTGAGKSLCYQLPGVVRGEPGADGARGTTLVISPLVALMEDQVSKLKAGGFRAERIHSARDRGASRAACIAYLAGELDFLFIAPERLAVPGFLEMLARRTPTLIAVDEAHCISAWGHDFRPEYRMLGARLPELRPAPVIALTATATEQVQDDIVKQLGLLNEQRFIRGFRRTNLAVEVAERKPSERLATILEVFSDPARLPALVYAPTRKEAEAISDGLRRAGFRGAAAYHAGLPPDVREKIQVDYLSGASNVIVATVAFGMGVDKADVRTVIHAALPQSVEGYYQEIGRAGRDGEPSRAILLYSFGDRRTHEFFLERDYPGTVVLDKIDAALKRLVTWGVPDGVRMAAEADAETFERALLKMRVHGAVAVNNEGELGPGSNPKWRQQYESARGHRTKSIAAILRFTETDGCRMVRLIRHFGDRDVQPCGICDHCDPKSVVVKSLRSGGAADSEDENSGVILRTLLRLTKEESYADGFGTGKLFTASFTKKKVERREFEHLLKELHRGGYVRLESSSFEKDGKTITFNKASLTHEGAERALQLPAEGAARPGVRTAEKPKKSVPPWVRRRS